jgi:large subunit ribosomal protein L25
MAKVITLTAQTREKLGKGSARRARRNGQIPAVIYGGKEAPQSILLDAREFGRVLDSKIFTHLFDITTDDITTRVLPRDLQLDPVRDWPIHIDFLRVTDETIIHVEVPVTIINTDKSPGLKRGGLLNVVYQTIDLMVPAANIPESLVIDVAGLEINQSVHISAVQLPEGAHTKLQDGDMTVVTIAAPSGKAEDDPKPAA